MAELRFASRPRSRGGRWIMLASVLAVAAVLALVGLRSHRPGLAPANATPASHGGAPGGSDPSPPGGGSQRPAPSDHPAPTGERNG